MSSFLRGEDPEDVVPPPPKVSARWSWLLTGVGAAAALVVPRAEAACPTDATFPYSLQYTTLYEPEGVLVVPPSSPTCEDGEPLANAGVCKPSGMYLPGSFGQADPEYPFLNDALFVFLPATGGQPAQNQNILKTAAFAGYRAIGLSYYNVGEVGQICQSGNNATCSPGSYWNECGYEALMERLTGVDYDYSPPVPAGSDVAMLVEDSISFRLLEVLNQAILWDAQDGVDDWNFQQYCTTLFCNTAGSTPPHFDRLNWDKIVLGGFSQGASYPHLLSLLRQTDAIVSIDGGSQRCCPLATGCTENQTQIANFYPDVVNLFGVYGGASSGAGEFAAFHNDREWYGSPSGQSPPSFPYVQLSSSYTQQEPDPGMPDPMTSDNVARTDQNAPQNCDQTTKHTSMATDNCMPTEATYTRTGGPNPSDWPQASPNSPAPLHLFETYVEGFCRARTQ